MIRETYFIKREDFNSGLTNALKSFTIYTPQEGLSDIEWKRLKEEDIDKVVYDQTRPPVPLKRFFLPPKERVSDSLPEEKMILIGVKACDLAALDIMDAVFLKGDFVDPFYRERRKNSLIISADCTFPRDVCFCILRGYKPYPEKGFDLNLSPSGEGVTQ